MTTNDLPAEWREKLAVDRLALAEQNRDTPYEVLRYNAEGTRYFRARRYCRSWRDDKGHEMPFGGGTYWTVTYGAVQFRRTRNPLGQTEYELSDGKRYTRSANGTEVPARVGTKKEVLRILNDIGIFQQQKTTKQ